MIPADLLALLRCPETRQTLAPVDATNLARLNAEIAAGRLRNVAGEIVTGQFEAALVRADGARAYPVRDGIPVLLVSEAVNFS